MAKLYPLRFKPILRRYVWGGRGLEALGKELGEGTDYAESWEVVDHGTDQSIVSAGPLAGTTLNALVRDHGRELLGRNAPQTQFPLLFKFLDAHDKLSIQVHPDDARAALLVPPDRGKTEAWVVIDAAPGSYLYAGLRRGFDRAALEREVARGTSQLCIERIEPRTGDCFFLPAGVVHALGPGLLIAEIQQASDTTYRLYDWDRVGADGKPRPLHIPQALEAIDYERGPVRPQQPRPTDRAGVERLVECDKFLLDRHTINGDMRLGGDDRSHIVAVIEGSATVEGDPAQQPLTRGSVILLPAEIGEVRVRASQPSVLLDAYLP